MTDYEQIRAVFSHLHASPDTITEVLHMAENKKTDPLPSKSAGRSVSITVRQRCNLRMNAL